MYPEHQREPEKRRRFEWRTIKVPISTVQFFMILGVLAVAGFAGYHYRARLRGPLTSVGSLFGLGPGGERGGGGGDQDLIEKRYAALSYVAGEVKIQRVRDLNWVSAETKMKLESGDRVRTFGGARAEVLFDDGSVLKIKPDSLIIIGDLMENVKTKVRQSSVRLMVSSIEADIKKSVTEGSQFRLEMPSATAEMNRARVSVDVGPGNDSRLKVFNGQVAVDTGQRKVAVDELSQVSIGAGRDISPAVRIVSAPRLSSPRSLAKFISNNPLSVSFSLEWLGVPHAAFYHVQVDTDRRFGRPMINAVDVRGLAYTVSGLAPGTYFARVGSMDGIGLEANFSEPLVFMIVLDKKPPEVTVMKFVSSKTAAGYDLYLEGNTEPAAQVVLAGRPLVVDDQGRFSASLRGIQSREKEVVLAARDQAGNQTLMPLRVAGGG